MRSNRLKNDFDSRFKSLESRLDALNDDFRNIQKGQVSSHEAEEAHDMECDVGEKSRFNNSDIQVSEKNNEEFKGEVDGKSTPKRA